MTKVGTGEAVEVEDPTGRISGSKGTGIVDGLRVWPFCLEAGEYSLTTFDVLGEGW